MCDVCSHSFWYTYVYLLTKKAVGMAKAAIFFLTSSLSESTISLFPILTPVLRITNAIIPKQRDNIYTTTHSHAHSAPTQYNYIHLHVCNYAYTMHAYLGTVLPKLNSQ